MSKKNSKKQHEKWKNKNNNNGTIYANLHVTFSDERYFATNVLLRFSATVLG